MKRSTEYQEDDVEFPPDARYQHKRMKGCAFYVLGWQTEPVSVCLCNCGFYAIEREGGGGRIVNKGRKSCRHTKAYYQDETEYERTGAVLAVMVGDDYKHCVDRDDLELIDPIAYCAECGQIGCNHDGRERDND